MILQQFELDNVILKATEALKLLQSERAMVEIDKDTLAVPIKLGDKIEGYAFHGRGKLVLDTIIETDKGAIGKPVEKELSEPFLMFGKTESIQQHMSMASKEDLMLAGYKEEREFIAKAEELLHEFSNCGKLHIHNCCSDRQGMIFAFPNETGKLDVLLADGSRLVYKAKEKVFIANKDKIVLKTPYETILSSSRKSMMIKRKCL